VWLVVVVVTYIKEERKRNRYMSTNAITLICFWVQCVSQA